MGELVGHTKRVNLNILIKINSASGLLMTQQENMSLLVAVIDKSSTGI